MTLKELKDKHIHFIGIGGIGMSGIAHLLARQGIQVSGSDLSQNDNVKKLQDIGVTFYQGHSPSFVQSKDIVVISTGIQKDNPELVAAIKMGIPVLHRADMLALLIENFKTIAISGTHGKTTSTALIGWILETAKLDPTVINGGVMNAWESNVKMGQGEWCVVEADESDGSFLKLPKDISLITNIDCEHMDFYEHPEKLYDSFEKFSTHYKSSGVAVLGIDHPSVYALWQKIKSIQPCRTFGVHPEADVRAENIQFTTKGTSFDLLLEDASLPIALSLYGHHNIQNALGAAAVALVCDIESSAVQKGLSTFGGVQRRFTNVGEWEGVTIIDDYAHHPIEIQATLDAAKKANFERVIAVLEPHRYSRLEAHFNDFSTCCDEADITIVLPVYAAQELPREGIDHKALAASMKKTTLICDKAEDLPGVIKEVVQMGDVVVCLGAGSISSLARQLPTQLNKYSQSKNRIGGVS